MSSALTISKDEKIYDCIVNDDRQAYILSNYSTLRTNLQWEDNAISSVINKISSIRVIPPSIDLSISAAHRQQYVLEMDANILLKTSEDCIQSSCKSIIKSVVSNHPNDPLLSEHNPFKTRQEYS